MQNLGQLSGVTGILLMAENFILAARNKWLEQRSGGLGKMYHHHHWLGATAGVILLFHPLLLWVQNLNLLPDYGQYPVWLGIAALLLMIILLAITFLAKWEYQKWKLSHRWLGAALILMGLHVLMVPGHLSGYPMLRGYLLVWAGAGIGAWIYRIWMQKTPGTKTEYQIR
jgi:predicted ferric reductase